jgi:heptosyltransferase-1
VPSPTPRAILIVRLSAIGDIVMASPLICALRERYPAARLAWLVQPECRELLDHNPDLDEVIVWPRGEWLRLWRQRRWLALWRELRRLRRELRARRFELALDLQGLLKSGVLAWLSGAPTRVGLGSKEGSRWLMTRVLERGGEADRIGSEYLDLAVRELGADPRRLAMRVVVSGRDGERAAARMRQLGVDKYALVCPFTTRPQKHWLADRWAQLAGRIEERVGMRVMMLGGPGDREAADEILSAAPPGLVSLVGETGIAEAAAWVEGASLLVGVDTGLTHMGIAFGIPTVALFGSTRPYLRTGRRNARVLYHSLPCSPCRRRPVCNGDFTCMRGIEVDEVMEAVGRVLEPAP